MKLWIDDVRPAPPGYKWCKTTDQTIDLIRHLCRCGTEIEILDIDHDSGDYVRYGGDYIRVLDWLEENGLNYPIRIHSMNPVGRQNMLAICQKNNWKVVY